MVRVAECFLASMPGASPVCEGQLVKCHLIPQRVLKVEIWGERVRDAKRGRVRAMGEAFPTKLRDLLWDPRVWVWGCGGIIGSAGHHGQLDFSRKLKIPRDRLPAELEEFAAVYGLVHYLDREYGERGRG